MPHARRRPPKRAFAKLDRMLKIEPADIRSPQQIQVRLSLSMPPQPQLLGLPAPFTAGQPFHLHQDHCSLHNRCTVGTIAFARFSGFGVQPRPSPDTNLAIASILRDMLCGRFVPARRVFEVKLLAVYKGPSHGAVFWRLRVGVKSPSGVQSHKDSLQDFSEVVRDRSRHRRRTAAPRGSQPPVRGRDPLAPSPARRPRRWRLAREERAVHPPAPPTSRARNRARRPIGRPIPPQWAGQRSDGTDGNNTRVRDWLRRRCGAKRSGPPRRPAVGGRIRPVRADAGQADLAMSRRRGYLCSRLRRGCPNPVGGRARGSDALAKKMSRR